MAKTPTKGPEVAKDSKTNGGLDVSDLVEIIKPLAEQWSETQRKLGTTEAVLENVAEGIRDTNKAINKLAESTETRIEATALRFEDKTNRLAAPKYPLIISVVGLIFVCIGGLMAGPLANQSRMETQLSMIQADFVKHLQLPAHEGAIGDIRRLDEDVKGLESRLISEIMRTKEPIDDQIEIIHADIVKIRSDVQALAVTVGGKERFTRSDFNNEGHTHIVEAAKKIARLEAIVEELRKKFDNLIRVTHSGSKGGD